MKAIAVLIVQSYILLSAIFVFLLFGLPFFGVYSGVLYTFLVPSQYSNPYSAWNVELFRALAPFVGLIASYLLFILYAVTSIFFPHTRFNKTIQRFYAPLEKVNKISILLTAPFLFCFGLWMGFSIIFGNQITVNNSVIGASIIMWVLWITLSRNTVVKLIIVVALLFSIYGVVSMLDEFIPEHTPDVYGAFTFNDKNGVYLVNYDGDYWLTYYIKKQTCWNGPDEITKVMVKKCRLDLVKKGNTAIVEAPTDLKPYLDKPVQITGVFVPVLGMIDGSQKEYRKFCVTRPNKICYPGKGNGNWYYSPLKIQSIKIIK